ncbi:DUF4402 domain-containing protein [Sphingobium sp. DEHP117]|uniref:DUF4402 domain-containing protein n=1 Tax=Sphingobium sp. DEHP117 TaxID=2993436 RepID=UPI0027D68AF5|nr:DUF4402 domain-containing protein [Sphingobium sp. DEHP117]MDQ4418996.1 DUF4402 domain-containing protein [Sphingobium sp. DEHP117]
MNSIRAKCAAMAIAIPGAVAAVSAPCQAQTVTKTADLVFGKIVRGSSNGTLSVSTAGARTCPAPLTCMGAVSAARFTITGTNNRDVSISVSPSVTLTASGGATMTATLTNSPTQLRLKNASTNAFTVGGSLTISGTQTAGSYTGTFTVTVNYL